MRKRGTMEILEKYGELLKYQPENEKIKVAVAMSGGVDSSATAYLLKKQGYQIIGVTMKHWDEEESEDSTKTCCTIDDIHDAKRVCNDLGISHYIINLKEEFLKEVVNPFIDAYKNGTTPNPCMICNRKIKLGKLVEQCLKLGVDYVATGHYAKIIDGNLVMGDDPNKDQAYFLAQVEKKYVNHLMFPLGGLDKPDVRLIAKELGVRVYAKKDSQEICFVEDGKLKEFLIDMTNGEISKNGDIIKKDGKIVGKHNGLAFYTIGQRKGLGIQNPTPLYVTKLNSQKNAVIVGDNEDLFKSELAARSINILGLNSFDDLEGLECFAKTRSRDKLHKVKVSIIDKERIKVNFIDDKVRAVTPGQGLVLYNEKGIVLASGYIL